MVYNLQLIRSPASTQYPSNALPLMIRQRIRKVHVERYVQIAVPPTSPARHALARHSHDVIAFGDAVDVHREFVSVEVGEFVAESGLMRETRTEINNKEEEEGAVRRRE